MKILVIGGNRFVGLRVTTALDQNKDVELYVLNRTGQVAHTKNATIYKGDRLRLDATYLDREWDVVLDFACYTETDARTGLNYFSKIGRYIYISTGSVYDLKPGPLKEEDFNPQKHDLTTPAVNPPTYQDGKRRAEAVFYQETQIPVLSVRFPLILGPDDYTHRLDFHIDRVKRSESIYIPNPAFKISMIHSEDAAKFLLWAIEQEKLKGPLNVCAKDPISLTALMGQIELVTGIKPILAKQEEDDNHSPYGVTGDLIMAAEKVTKAGFTPRPISDWLPSLIGEPAKSKPRFVH